MQSLGYRTELIFPNFDGEVIDRGPYLVVKTHSNPNYFWGNLLIFRNAPQKGDVRSWPNLFKKEFPDPRIYHMTFGWSPSSPSGEDPSEFLAAGFRLEKSTVLTTQEVHHPKKHHPYVKVKPVESDEDFERSIQIQIACGGSELSKQQWDGFYRLQMDRYRQMIVKGYGLWFGAYLEEELVGGLGIFTDRNVGRFQIVSTHPDYQRKGVCGALVYQSAQYAFKSMGVESLVMIADEAYHAAKIYESVGFKPTEKLTGLCWWDKERN